MASALPWSRSVESIFRPAKEPSSGVLRVAKESWLFESLPRASRELRFARQQQIHYAPRHLAPVSPPFGNLDELAQHYRDLGLGRDGMRQPPPIKTPKAASDRNRHFNKVLSASGKPFAITWGKSAFVPAHDFSSFNPFSKS